MVASRSGLPDSLDKAHSRIDDLESQVATLKQEIINMRQVAELAIAMADGLIDKLAEEWGLDRSKAEPHSPAVPPHVATRAS